MERFTVSKTDRTRPYWVQEKDPANQRFRMISSNAQEWNWFWKKMTPATQCWCCSSRHWRSVKRARRSSWKREVRHDLGDYA